MINLLSQGTKDLVTILALIGSLCVSAISLYFSFYKTFEIEKPSLETRVIRSQHTNFPPSSRMETLFLTKNAGDRPTTITKVRVLFKIDGTGFSQSCYKFYLGLTTNEHVTSTVDVNAHESVYFLCVLEWGYIIEKYNATAGDFLPCKFTIYHTHGESVIEDVSVYSPVVET